MDEGQSRRPSPARRRSPWPALFLVSLGLLLAITAFGAGMLAERVLFAGGSLLERAGQVGGWGGDEGSSGDDRFARLAEVEELIREESYYRPGSEEAMPTFEAGLERGAASGLATAAAAASPSADLDAYLRELEYGAIRGMTAALPDDYTTFLEPVEQVPVAQQISGEYEGIGVLVAWAEQAFTITAVYPSSPAEEAGLLAGDVIEEVDGRRLEDGPSGEALGLLRGPVGSSVNLTVRRPGRAEPIEVAVVRRAVIVPSVVYHRAADGRVAWIGISIFGDRTTAQLDDALRRAEDEGVEGIVLDLRQNGGGWVTSAREAIGRFVPSDRGPALYEDGSATEPGDVTPAAIIGGGEKAFDVPLVVLVDGGTASAAEIVAGALRAYGRAKLVGTPTFGKGLVQRVHDFPDGSSVRITSAEWLTPDKRPIPQGGLTPDVTVEVVADGSPGTDPQLDRAVELALGGG